MAGAFGWKFILFSAIFYMFLGFILNPTMGNAVNYLSNTIDSPTNYTAGSYNTNVTTANITTIDYVRYIWQNPFSGIGWLAWLSVAFLIADIYIIVTSVIP